MAVKPDPYILKDGATKRERLQHDCEIVKRIAEVRKREYEAALRKVKELEAQLKLLPGDE